MSDDDDEYQQALQRLRAIWADVKANADELTDLARVRLQQIWTAANALPEGDLKRAIIEGWAVLEVLLDGAETAIAIAAEVAVQEVEDDK